MNCIIILNISRICNVRLRHGVASPESFLSWNHNQIIDLHDAGSYNSVAMCDPIVINVFH